PRSSRSNVLLVRSHAIPGGEPELQVLSRIVGPFQHMGRYVGLRKVGHRIAARFEQQENILTFGNPTASEAHAHASAQTLDVQKPFGQWFGYDELAEWSR